MSNDGFGYDLYKARVNGNIFERIFHNRRLSFWMNAVNYAGKKVLDVGCNTGILLVPLKKRGVDISGVDISKHDIAQAKRNLRRENLPDNCVCVAEAKKLPYRVNYFDVVLLSDILEHVENPVLVAQESIRVLKPGGFVFATVPNELHPVVRYPWLRKLFTGRKNVDEHPDMPFSKEKLARLFPGAAVLKMKLIGFGSEIFGAFQKVER